MNLDSCLFLWTHLRIQTGGAELPLCRWANGMGRFSEGRSCLSSRCWYDFDEPDQSCWSSCYTCGEELSWPGGGGGEGLHVRSCKPSPGGRFQPVGSYIFALHAYLSQGFKCYFKVTFSAFIFAFFCKQNKVLHITFCCYSFFFFSFFGCGAWRRTSVTLTSPTSQPVEVALACASPLVCLDTFCSVN